MLAMMITTGALFLLVSVVSGVPAPFIPFNIKGFPDIDWHTGVDFDNFYRDLQNLTKGKLYDVSEGTHEMLKLFRDDSPDLDPAVFPSFNCSTVRSPPHAKPTSVHALTPFDIDVVAAMGDSITAAFGALSFTLADLFVEFRGVSWSIGGDSTLKKHVTIPNIIKQFNPNVKGASRGVAPPLIDVPWNNLNVAVSGSTVYGLLDQAKELVKRMNKDPQYDFKNDWKLLTIFIGGNDLCACCRDYKGFDILYTPQNYIKQMQNVLDFLRDNVPRLFVNIADAPDVTQLQELKTLKCRVTHYIECKCGTSLGETAIKYTENTKKEYYKLLREMIYNTGRYDGKEDFAIVLQPFVDNTEVPLKPDGSVDRSYWAPDCFHFSGKSHSASAHALWNNMLEPVGKKDSRWQVGSTYKCPSKEHPYFYTRENSQGKPSL